MRGPRQGGQALRCDRAAATQAGAVGAGVQPREGRLDEGQLVLRTIAQREIALLGKDLAGRRSLGAVGHLPGRDDRLAELVDQPSPLSLERFANDGQIRGVHRGTVRFDRPGCAFDILRGSTNGRHPTLAIAIDPVCGMEVDTTTSTLSYEYDGTTYWFCSKGCLLDFQDDPEKYLDPEYSPSM